MKARVKIECGTDLLTQEINLKYNQGIYTATVKFGKRRAKIIYNPWYEEMTISKYKLIDWAIEKNN